MKLRYVFLMVVMFVVVFILSGCLNRPIEDDEKNEVPVLSLITTDFILQVGDQSLIIPIVEGVDDNVVVEYLSMDTNIASVIDGTIKGISEGETQIIISLKDFPDISVKANVKIIKSDQQIIDEIILWAKNYIGEELDRPIDFPKKHPTIDSKLTWVSNDLSKLSNEGKIFQEKYDINVDVTVTVSYNSLLKSETFSVIITGSSPQGVALDFYSQFNDYILRDYIVDTESSNSEANLTWYSSNTDVFTNEGKFIKPFNDISFEIIVTVFFENDNITKQFSKTYVARGYTINEKAEIIKEWVLSQNQIYDGFITESIELPIRYNEFDATLEWVSNKPHIISNTGVITLSINALVNLSCKVTIKDDYATFYLSLEVTEKNYNDKWLAIEDFLNQIFIDEIKTKKYLVSGVGPTYTAYNYGYIPFYDHNRSLILDGYITGDNRPGTIRPEIKWVVIHDTANNNIGADADSHNNIIQNFDASWHYTIDDKKIYQHIPDEEVAWHAGTQDGNRYGIGIETCINNGVDYIKVMQRTAKLTSELMKEFNLTLSDVKQHYDMSGKNCPQVMRSQNLWDDFISLVELEYFAITQLEGVEFIWESKSIDILDDTGKVYNHPEVETNISYKVTVKYNGEVREYSHTSKLMPLSWL